MAGIPLREAIKIRQLVGRIQSGSFDAHDVDALLIKLRPYAGNRPVFRDITDFVAHADARNRGAVCDSMTRFADAMRFFVEYTGKNQAVDLSQPFPAYVYRLFISQAKLADEHELRTQFRLSRQSLINKIEGNFKIERTSKTYTLRAGKDGRDFLAALKYVVGFIHSKPAYEITNFHTQLYDVLAEWKIDHDRALLDRQRDNISLALMCLVSGTEMLLPEGDKATCILTAESNFAIEIGQRRLPTGELTSEPTSFGSLQINGEIDVVNSSQPLRVAYPVITSQLNPRLVCDPVLFQTSEEMNEFGPFRVTVFDTEPDMALTSEFRITKASLIS